jgi:hypothetical protein
VQNLKSSGGRTGGQWGFWLFQNGPYLGTRDIGNENPQKSELGVIGSEQTNDTALFTLSCHSQRGTLEEGKELFHPEKD